MSATIEKLKKVIEAMQSNHVQSVEAGYECEMDEIRFYTAVTYKSGEAHRYTVRVQDWFNDQTNEMERIAKCNCHAGANNMICRHVVKVAELDTERTGKPLFLDDLAKYKAHKCFEKKAVAPALTNISGETIEPCGCVFNWNDKFYSFLCRAHDDEQRMHDWAEQESEEYSFEAAA